MWLINTITYKLKYVETPQGIPYAILSHTWDDGEVSFGDMADITEAKKKPGFKKIEHTCQLAKARSIRYAWVDTCCIDKTSSAELTEAINSMFQWYKNSTICFVFLFDLPMLDDEKATATQVPHCRWFKRGWTLQELIAARRIEFYDQNWNIKVDNVFRMPQLSVITGIPVSVLESSDLLPTISIAKRMSWASMRTTTREEDLAYCLFGIFDVNLPLIYGEGLKAFIRLQEAIASNSNDLSLFAWMSVLGDQDLRGLFASSPSEFRMCGNIQRSSDPAIKRVQLSLTNAGFDIDSDLIVRRGDYVLSLQCFDGNDPRTHTPVSIQLLKTSHGYIRHQAHQLASSLRTTTKIHPQCLIHIPKFINSAESCLLGLQLEQKFSVTISNTSGFSLKVHEKPEHLWNRDTACFLTNGYEQFTGLIVLSIEGYGKRSGVSSARDISGLLSKHTLSCVVVFGLKAQTYSSVRNEASQMVQVLNPWAAVYQDNDPVISSITSEEHRLGTTHVLTSIGAAVRSQISNGDTLPSILRYGPLWKSKHVGKKVPLAQPVGSSLASLVEISVVASLGKEGAQSMYALSINL